MPEFALVTPSLEKLPGLMAALQTGWSHQTDPKLTRKRAEEDLAAIAKDAEVFIASKTDEVGIGTIPMPDGSTRPRLPSIQLWMWDGAFCGAINFNWQPGTEALPPYMEGHIGYSVVPAKRRLGYATQALDLMLPHARKRGMAYVELTTDPDNLASQKVILANGGKFIEAFITSEQGEKALFRYHIPL
ncbi:MAG: GNAT family N-acetyltransferase [Proteobacteria bacterium]|nr:GNAT family N-acetyltransferase [Pseudomonadota bacterium]